MLTTLKRVAMALALLLPGTALAEPPETLQSGTLHPVCPAPDRALNVVSAIVEQGDKGLVVAMATNGCEFVKLPLSLPVADSKQIADAFMTNRKWRLWLLKVPIGGESVWWVLWRDPLGPEPTKLAV